MPRIDFEAEADKVSAELTRRGIPSNTRLHVQIRVISADELQGMALAETGTAFDWLAEKPELYSDADLLERAQ